LETKLEKNEIFRARKFVFEHYRNPSLSLSEVAAHVGLSSAHFSHIFKQLSGTSFVMFVQNKRVDEAKKLIRNSNLSLSEICFSCGFNSVTNFNRVFRRLEHCNPSQYRKTNK
jgi:AraC-like DNA-binding protein